MTPATRTQLRELLLEFRARPSDAGFEEVLPQVMDLRLGCAEVDLPPEVRAVQLKRIRALALARSASKPLLISRRGALLFAGMAVAAVVLIWAISNRAARNEIPMVRRGAPSDTRQVHQEPKQEPKPNLPGPNEPGRVVEKHRPKGPVSPSQSPLPAEREAARFATLVGEPRWKRSGGSDAHRANMHGILPQGSTVVTGDADRCELLLADGSRVWLDFNTTVTLAGPGKEGFDLSLDEGHLWCTVTPHSRETPFAISSKAATAVALGTEFGMRVEKKLTLPTTRLTVKHGRVKFFNRQGSVEVGPSAESTASTSGRPSEPKRVPVLGRFPWIGRSSLGILGDAPEVFDCGMRADAPIVMPGFAATYTADKWLVTDVDPDSLAYRGGLRCGDEYLPGDLVKGKSFHEGDRVFPMEVFSPDYPVASIRDGRRSILHIRSTRRAYAGMGNRTFTQYGQLFIEALEGDSRAFTGFGKFAKLHPIAPVLHDFGLLLERRDWPGKAIRLYHRALAIEPRNARYHRSLASALKTIGNTDRALQEYTTASSLAAPTLRADAEISDLMTLQGRANEAIQRLENAAGNHPASSAHWHQFAVALLRQRNLVRAETAARKALDLDPRNSDRWVTVSSVQGARGDLEGALASADQAIRLSPASSGAYSAKGILLGHADDHEGAIEAFKTAYKLDPSFISLINLLSAYGSTSETTSQLPQSVEPLVRKAIRLDTSDQFLLNHAVLLSALGHLSEAEQMARRALRQSPADLAPYEVLADIARKMGRRKEEKELLLRALGIGPSVEILGRLGRHYEDLADYENAKTYYRRAYDLGHDGNSFLLLRFTLEKLGDTDARIALCVDYSQRPSRNRRAKYWAFDELAVDAQAKRDVARAEDCIRKAVKWQPENDRGHMILGDTLMQLGRTDEAEKELRNAIELNPKVPRSCQLLGRILHARGDYAEEETLYRRGITAAPQEAAFYGSLAYVLLQQGVRLDEAVEAYKHAIQLRPGMAAYHANLGESLKGLGRRSEAEAAWMWSAPGNEHRLK